MVDLRSLLKKRKLQRSDADVVKLVDTLDLGSSAVRLGGSSPFIRTKLRESIWTPFFI
jgi:hypothetical protein